MLNINNACKNVYVFYYFGLSLVFVCPPEAPVQWNVLVEKHVIKASFGAVLRYYGNVRHLDAAADEFAQVRMIKLPANEKNI